MKSVVIFYPHIGEYGGIERNILALAEEIDRRGFEPVLVCYYDRISMNKLFLKLRVVVLLDHWNPFIKAYRLRRWLRLHKGDMVGMPLFFGGKAGFYAGILNPGYFVLHYTDPPSLLGIAPLASQVKNIIQATRRYFSGWLLARGVRDATVRITMTKRNAKELERLYAKTFTVVLQGGLEPTGKVNTSHRCLDPVLRIFSICRIASSKNLDWILSTVRYLKASSLFDRDFKKMEVIIAGTGPHLDHLQKKSAELGIEDCVHFPGFLNSSEVEEEYRRSDLFLVPGRQGYGLPVLEALYRRVPVVLNVESRISEILCSNPWTAVSDDSPDSFQATVFSHITKLRQKYPDAVALNNLPNERRWATEIGISCKWWEY